MGLAVISDNTSIKVSAAIANSRTTNGTLYTCAANAYAEVQLAINYSAGANTTVIFYLDGYEVAGGNVATTAVQFNGHFTPIAQNVPQFVAGIRVGPSQVLTVAFSAGSVATASVTGVQFINSP